jgi:hypothetical protein
MNCEPHQLSLKTQKKRGRRSAGDAGAAALDAAFAEYVRFDHAEAQQPGPVASIASSCGNDPHLMQCLVADITAQLAAIDLQREQLAALLRSI